MRFSTEYQTNADELIAVFEDAFAASEGVEEGRHIAALVRNLLAKTPREDIHVFSAIKDDALAGACIFTRLSFAGENRAAFLLSPVAVAPRLQAQGVGEAMLTHGLNALRAAGVDIAVTYGDPNYYARVGFAPVTEAIVPAPLTLSQPHGWLAQSLTDDALAPLNGPARCADALNNPSYW